MYSTRCWRVTDKPPTVPVCRVNLSFYIFETNKLLTSTLTITKQYSRGHHMIHTIMLRSCRVRWRTSRLLPACISSPTLTSISTAFQHRLGFPTVSYGPRTCRFYHSTTVTSATQPTSPAKLSSDSNMAQSVIEMTGQSGRSYIVEEVLQQREIPPRYVYLAR